MRLANRINRAVYLIGLLTLLGGCATTQPWEREQLSRPAMDPDGDGDREDLRRHVLTTREGASGSMGGGGGGCGCNWHRGSKTWCSQLRTAQAACRSLQDAGPNPSGHDGLAARHAGHRHPRLCNASAVVRRGCRRQHPAGARRAHPADQEPHGREACENRSADRRGRRERFREILAQALAPLAPSVRESQAPSSRPPERDVVECGVGELRERNAFVSVTRGHTRHHRGRRAKRARR